MYSDGTMKRTFVLVAGLGCLCLRSSYLLPVDAAPIAVAAAPAVKPPKGFGSTIVLWPNGAPGAVGKGEGDVPKLYVYPATGVGVRSAVIVMPGGGYRNLSMEKEGGEEGCGSVEKSRGGHVRSAARILEGACLWGGLKIVSVSRGFWPRWGSTKSTTAVSANL